MARKISIPVIMAVFILLCSFAEFEHLPAMVENLQKAYLEGGKITIAEFVNTNENVPAATYSSVSNQYLVVYESLGQDADVMGQFVDAGSGDLVGGWFHIAKTSDMEKNPAVVYDSFQDRFLVVWEHKLCLSNKCYYEIQGRLIYGASQNGGSNFAGPVFTIANEHTIDDSGYDLFEPALAYNQDDHQYAVVYTRYQPTAVFVEAVYGQMLSSHASQPAVLSGVFEGFEVISAGVSISPEYPQIAWGRHSDTFLVVWENFWGDEVNTIQANYLHDKYQGAGMNQVVESGSWIVAPHPSQSSLSDKDDYDHPSVAYDEKNRNFVVVYMHTEFDGFNETRRIYGQRIHNLPQPSPYVSPPLPVDTVLDANYTSHEAPYIVYSGIEDEMFVIYRTFYVEMGDYLNQIYQRTLQMDHISDRVLVHTSTAKSFLGIPVAAATNDGRALVVWDEQYSQEPYDYDVYAQRIKAFSLVYLPNVVR